MATVPSIDQFSRQVVEILPLLLREFGRMEKNDLVRGKITLPQMIALDALTRRERLKMTELAGILAVKMSSATVLADRLIGQGMVQRQRDEKDRRLVWVSLTPKGRKVVSRFVHDKRRSVRTIFGVLTSEERAQYLKILLKVRSHFHSRG